MHMHLTGPPSLRGTFDLIPDLEHAWACMDGVGETAGRAGPHGREETSSQGRRPATTSSTCRRQASGRLPRVASSTPRSDRSEEHTSEL